MCRLTALTLFAENNYRTPLKFSSQHAKRDGWCLGIELRFLIVKSASGRNDTLAKLIPIQLVRAQELRESRGGRPGLPVPNYNSPYGLCERKATLN